MLRRNVVRSTPLRLALMFAALFIASFVFAGAIAQLKLKADLSARLDNQISETFKALEGLYEAGDTGDLVAAVDRLSQAASDKSRVYRLVDQTGARIAGNISAGSVPEGWTQAMGAELGFGGEERAYRLFSGIAGHFRLTVGASSDTTTEIVKTALSSFAWATLAVLILAITGGLLIAARLQTRIDAIGITLSAVGEGRLGARVPVSAANDDFDELATQINTALDRLGRLVEGMRQVSVDLAHELKTPINRLCILLDEAIAHLSNQDSRPALDDALSEALRINETFEALLRIAQIESGTRRSKFVDFDLGDVVRSTFDVFEPVAEEKRQSLTLRHGPEPLIISGDPRLIVQLVANLIENAIRHCPPKASICIEATRSDERCQIVVSDDGPGIPIDEHSKVFERLYRLEKSRTTNGSGLGLSLVKAIADLHRASITLLDNGPGLKVRVSFPAPDDETDLTKL